MSLWATSGLSQIELGQLVMMVVGLSLLFLAVRKGFEPLLLVPIGFGTILANIPGAGFDAAPIYDQLGNLECPGGLLYYIYNAGIATGQHP
jgi:oxaloacetate decarboxylase beta subunit